jgi:RimJ/RimL family protein N-acetyltransferase
LSVSPDERRQRLDLIAESLDPVPAGQHGRALARQDGPVGDDLLERARGLWEELAGGRFPDPGTVRVVEDPDSRICPRGWAGIVRLAGAVLATAPTAAQAELLRRTTDPGALPVLDLLGPAQLAYTADLPPAADPVEWAGAAELSELIGAVARDEADESGVAGLRRAAVVREDGRIIAAAGWVPWPARTAHLCVLTAADARGCGLATQAAAAATADALAAGMLPQWRARTGASQRVAAKLGYRVLGEQLSLHLHT